MTTSSSSCAGCEPDPPLLAGRSSGAPTDRRAAAALGGPAVLAVPPPRPPSTEPPGPPGTLAGLRLGVKSNLATAGVVTLAGTAARSHLPPATTDSAAVARVAAAGAVPAVVTGMDELAYGFTGRNEHHGRVPNPHDPALLAGGSSSGSAALVALGAVDVALGTDTNGSVRVPAALCGIWGYRASRWPGLGAGLVPLAPSLDAIGLLAADADVLLVAARALRGAPLPLHPPDPRVAVVEAVPQPPGTREAVAAVAGALGASQRVTLPWLDGARGAARTTTAAEAGRAHAGLLQGHGERLGRTVRQRLAAGLATDPGELAAARTVRRRLLADLDATFSGADVLVLPTLATAPPRADADEVDVGGEPLPVNTALGWSTAPFSLLAAPAVAVPVPGSHPGAPPPSVQLVGRPGTDRLLLELARHLAAEGVARAVLAP